MTKKPRSTSVARRKFLKTGALAAGAAAAGTLAVPQVSRAQTVTLRMQGSWGAKDVFNEFAEDYVKRVNEMAGWWAAPSCTHSRSKTRSMAVSSTAPIP